MAKPCHGPCVASGAVSDLDFAAWLEGRLSETAAARIEAAVAADPEMRRAALELSEVLGMPLPAAPARLEVRAKALVGFEVEQRAGRVGLFDWLFASEPALRPAAPGNDDGRGRSSPSPASCWAAAWANRWPRSAMPMASQSDTANELTEFLVSDGI